MSSALLDACVRLRSSASLAHTLPCSYVDWIDVSGGAREYGFVDVDFLAIISAAANATQAAGAGVRIMGLECIVL